MVVEAIICIFAKPPRPGEVKTRLAADLGIEEAAALARAFLQDSWAVAQEHPWARPILATTSEMATAVDLRPAPEQWSQGNGDLGQRMERVLRRALGHAPAAIALGSDSPGMPPSALEQTRELLQAGNHAVLGPADDGGYYLLALSRCPEGLLQDLPWSRPDTMAATLERLEWVGLRAALCEPWFDVDHLNDLHRLRRLLQRGEIIAPHTAEALRKLYPLPGGV